MTCKLCPASNHCTALIKNKTKQSGGQIQGLDAICLLPLLQWVMVTVNPCALCFKMRCLRNGWCSCPYSNSFLIHAGTKPVEVQMQAQCHFLLAQVHFTMLLHAWYFNRNLCVLKVHPLRGAAECFFRWHGVDFVASWHVNDPVSACFTWCKSKDVECFI